MIQTSLPSNKPFSVPLNFRPTLIAERLNDLNVPLLSENSEPIYISEIEKFESTQNELRTNTTYTNLFQERINVDFGMGRLRKPLYLFGMKYKATRTVQSTYYRDRIRLGLAKSINNLIEGYFGYPRGSRRLPSLVSATMGYKYEWQFDFGYWTGSELYRGTLIFLDAVEATKNYDIMDSPLGEENLIRFDQGKIIWENDSSPKDVSLSYRDLISQINELLFETKVDMIRAIDVGTYEFGDRSDLPDLPSKLLLRSHQVNQYPSPKINYDEGKDNI